MGFPIRKVSTVATTGNLNGISAGTQTPGATLNLTQVEKNSLATEVTVDVETSTMTLFVDWQVSDDATTWLDVTVPNAAANVTLATGTAGADASVTKVIEAPSCVYTFRYARAAVRNGVAAGNTVDTYSIKYHYLKPSMV